MAKISELFLFLLLFLNIQTSTTEEKNPAIEIQIGTKVQYDKNRNYFKFKYEGEIGAKILFELNDDIDIYLISPKGKRTQINSDYYYKDYNYFANLTETGTYYIESYCEGMKCEIGGSFNTYIFGGSIDSSGLTKKAYYRDFTIDSYNQYYGMNEYRVSGLKEAKYVYFSCSAMNEYDYEYNYYYIYYPENPNPPVDPDYPQRLIHYDNETIFEVYDVEKNESYKNVKVFKFEPNKEYIIKIHALKYYYYYNHQELRFKYVKYYIFPITQDNFRVITGEEDFFFSNGPMLGLIPPNINKTFTMIIGSIAKNNMFLVARTPETIELNLENIFTKIEELKFSESGGLNIIENDPYTTLAFMIPAGFESGMKFYLINIMLQECNDSFLIPANTSAMIICDGEKEFKYFNNITTFTSDKKNMHIINSDRDEATDYIIQNYLGLPIYVEKSTQNQTIKVKKYPPKFTFFGAENPFIFKTFYSFGEKSKDYSEVDFNNYKNLTQTNIRINSRYLPWLEFYNFYFNQLDTKLNFYIKQIYGGSELYECNADDVNEKDLTFLTTPISNVKCKNRKSIFNRLFTLDGTKILSGYIAPDSYFDIYVEINKETESTNIDVSPVMSQQTKMNHASKYLRKNIQYNINFALNHMIKLEQPGSDVEVTITKGENNYKLNSLNPTVELTGKGYTIKSNNDVMVYFLGRLSEWQVVQREIDIEQSKGKIVKVSNVDDDIILDIGFEGFYPSTLPIKFERRENGVHYYDNIYEKVKGKLVKGEKVYIYHYYNKNQRLKIDYISKSLENKNNDFNIFFIPGTNEENTILINTYQINYIKPHLHMCGPNIIMKFSYLLSNEEEESVIFTFENITKFSQISKIKLFKGDNKISFTSNQPFVFSYSYYDLVDNDYFENNQAFLNERKVFDDLTIEEVGDKNNVDDMIKIKFKPNYNQSSTRYIIIIAQKNGQNTLENFKDYCFMAELLNNRTTGVKVDTIYDIGDRDLIDAEVDISDILYSGNKYLVNIISQELRFDKKINFYQPKEFNHVGKKPNDNDSDKGGKGNDGDDGSSSSLALAITLPIVGVIIIAVVVIFILKRKEGASSEKIEQLTSNE